MEDNRKRLNRYLQEGYISDEKVDLIMSLLGAGSWLSKDDILKLSGFDTDKTFDTAYPQPYADRIRQLYPDFNEGCHIYDYSDPEQPHGKMVNIYNLFAKHVLKTLCT